MTHELIASLQRKGSPQQLLAAEILLQERDEALRDAWSLRRANEQLRTRLHEVAAERNAALRNTE